jgi:predicted nuclease of predicted toxin-antitoxin system
VKFLIDANLPAALAGWLAGEGHDVAHVDDLLPAPAADRDIWLLAVREGRIIVSKDSDFAQAAERDPTVQVVCIRCGNLKLREFSLWFAARRAVMESLLDLGERVVELQ